MDSSTIRGELVGHHSEPGNFTLRNRIRPSFGSPPTFNLNKVFPRISIRLKLAIAFAVVALGPLAVVSILGTRETLARLDTTARYTLAHDLEVAERETVRALAAATDHVVYLTESVLQPLFSIATTPPAARRELEQISASLIETEPTIHQVKVIDADGRYLLRMRGSARVDDPETADGGQYYAWVAAGLALGEHAYLPVEIADTAVSGEATLIRVIAILVPVHGSDGGLRGVVVGEAYASRLFASLDRASAGFHGVTGLVDDRGLMLFHSERLRDSVSPFDGSGPVLLVDDVPAIDASTVLTGGIGSLRTSDDRLVSYRPLRLAPADTPHLTLFRVVPMGALPAPARGFVRSVLLAAPVVVLVVLFMGMVAADQFTRPLFRIREAVWRLARQEQPTPLLIETNDELEDLATDFWEVARRIDDDRLQREALIEERTRLLERARSDLTDVLAQSADGIVILDATGAIRTWSGGASALLGWESGEVVGRDLDALLYGDAGTAGVERRARADELRRRGALVNVVATVQSRDGGMLDVSITQTLQRDATGAVTGASVILRDHRERARLEQHLRRSERLAAMSVMAAGLAHEINNPLAIIGNRIECMQQDARRQSDPGTVQQDLEVLHEHVERLGALTRGLLRFAREESPPNDPVALGTVAEGIVNLLRQTFAMRGLRLEPEIAADLPTVAVDAKAIETVMVNLLLNAANATPAGGLVALAVRAHTGVVELEVCDTGPGIPLERREQVFEPFYTTKGAGRGTGLGLAVCRSIVDRYGGTIRIDEASGGGCRVVVHLPDSRLEAEWTQRAS